MGLPAVSGDSPHGLHCGRPAAARAGKPGQMGRQEMRLRLHLPGRSAFPTLGPFRKTDTHRPAGHPRPGSFVHTAEPAQLGHIHTHRVYWVPRADAGHKPGPHRRRHHQGFLQSLLSAYHLWRLCADDGLPDDAGEAFRTEDENALRLRQEPYGGLHHHRPSDRSASESLQTDASDLLPRRGLHLLGPHAGHLPHRTDGPADQPALPLQVLPAKLKKVDSYTVSKGWLSQSVQPKPCCTTLQSWIDFCNIRKISELIIQSENALLFA